MRPKAGTRSEHVRELIEEGIATGSFPPGRRLDEMELAERFNVSRTPLREALFSADLRRQPQRVPARAGHRSAPSLAPISALAASCSRPLTDVVSRARRHC